jgi:flagellar protein FlgJ
MATAAAALYTDFQSIAQLKAQAREDSSAVLDKVARQFESLFTQMMLKSMREAGLGEGIFDNKQTQFYRDMYDQQIALHLSESGGIGLAEVIKRQLGGEASEQEPTPKSMEDYLSAAMAVGGKGLESIPVPEHAAVVPLQETEEGIPTPPLETTDPATWDAEDFVEQLWPWAREAADKLGLEAPALLAQAALETGWGKHLMRAADGSSAHNLFGIKADRRWDGAKAHVGTLEFEQGVAVRKKDFFRAYESFRDSFSDYVDFLRSNPRYGQALESTGDARAFFAELQKAGYATDPRYAEKIGSVMESPEMQRALERLKNESGQPL